MRRKTTLGFTLIELSIALVIIGLIVGGALVGRDMVRAAQVRKQIAQIESLDTAMGAFRSKYNCIPGDCDSAVQLGIGTSGGDGDDGDGNGYINSGTTNPLDGTEIRNVWIHLRNAEFLAWEGAAGGTPGVNSPPLVMSGMAIPRGGISQYTAGGLWLAEDGDVRTVTTTPAKMSGWLLAPSTNSSHNLYLPQDAFAIDSKVDDGYPLEGKVLSSDGFNTCKKVAGHCISTASPFASDNGTGTSCINDLVTPAIYDFTSRSPSETTLCEPFFRRGF